MGMELRTKLGSGVSGNLPKGVITCVCVAKEHKNVGIFMLGCNRGMEWIMVTFPLEFNKNFYFCRISHCPGEQVGGIDGDIGLDLDGK